MSGTITEPTGRPPRSSALQPAETELPRRSAACPDVGRFVIAVCVAPHARAAGPVHLAGRAHARRACVFLASHLRALVRCREAAPGQRPADARCFIVGAFLLALVPLVSLLVRGHLARRPERASTSTSFTMTRSATSMGDGGGAVARDHGTLIDHRHRHRDLGADRPVHRDLPGRVRHAACGERGDHLPRRRHDRHPLDRGRSVRLRAVRRCCSAPASMSGLVGAVGAVGADDPLSWCAPARRCSARAQRRCARRPTRSGCPKWRTILEVVLPTAIAGIITGVILAIARVIGETAPLLVTAGFTAFTGQHQPAARWRSDDDESAAPAARCTSSTTSPGPAYPPEASSTGPGPAR